MVVKPQSPDATRRFHSARDKLSDRSGCVIHMDLKQYRNKLVGSEEERAVSPVIGVILMVAITVILAAVIAAFVLDMGDDIGSGTVDAAVSSDVDNSEEYVEISVTEMGEADEFILRGDVDNGDGVELTELNNTGDVMTISNQTSTNTGVDVDEDALAAPNGTANVVAVGGDDESDIHTIEWDWD